MITINPVTLLFFVLLVISLTLVIGGVMILLLYFIAKAYVAGVKAVQATLIEEPPEEMQRPTSEQLREAIAHIPVPCDIVFDTLVVTQFVTGVIAHSWDRLYATLAESASMFVETQPVRPTALIVRAISISRDGRADFQFEALNLPNTRVTE